MTEVGGQRTEDGRQRTDHRRWEVEKVRRWERLIAAIFMQALRLPITMTEDRKQRAVEECGSGNGECGII